jgi:hypothetical protein
MTGTIETRDDLFGWKQEMRMTLYHFRHGNIMQFTPFVRSPGRR